MSIQLVFTEGAAVRVAAPGEALGMGPNVDKLIAIEDPASGITVIVPLDHTGCKIVSDALLKSNAIATLPSGLSLPGADPLDLPGATGFRPGRNHHRH